MTNSKQWSIPAELYDSLAVICEECAVEHVYEFRHVGPKIHLPERSVDEYDFLIVGGKGTVQKADVSFQGS